MAEPQKTWRLTPAEWETLVEYVRATHDALDDGALARVERTDEGRHAIAFYATDLNKPEGWIHPIVETLGGISRSVASIGRARTDRSGAVQFEMAVAAAAEALAADYEGGALDLDDVGFEQAALRALDGTEADRRWVMREFDRLVRVGGSAGRV